jgi:hypothetical protein
MRAFIVHAEADRQAAEDLRAALATRGLRAEIETGERGFAHLQTGDVVVALWSGQSVFSPYRLHMEKRLLDAWADERLVLVKLDHSILPVGLRDLPAIDASFVQARGLKTWPEVERAVRAAMAPPVEPAPPPMPAVAEEPRGVGSGGPPGSYPPAAPAAPKAKAAVPPARPADARGGSGPLLALLLVAGLGAAGVALGLRYLGPDLAPGGMGALGLVVLIALVWAVLSGRRKRGKGPKAAARAAASASPPQPQPGERLFVSYAHADADRVTPVVAAVEQTGRPVWIDKAGIQAGEGWAGEIVRAIKSAKGVVVMCSPRAFDSDHIKREVYLADRYRKPMLPVFIEEASPPEDFEYFFAGVQWLELFKLPEAERPLAVARALAAV